MDLIHRPGNSPIKDDQIMGVHTTKVLGSGIVPKNWMDNSRDQKW